MSTLAGDFWVCGDCRSINNAGARQCYNCRTPRDRAAVDPDTIDPSSSGPLRTIELPPFKASRWAAALASVLILIVGVMQIVQFSLLTQLWQYTQKGTETPEQFAYVGSVGILAFGVALLALIAWALWLSRTVRSMPALGLGYPPTDGMMAFLENFIPVLNLWRVPAIVRDVARRLEPKVGGDETMTRGEALVFAAWISVFGGFLVPRVLGLFTDNTDTLIVITGIGLGLGVVGAIFLVVLIWWVEGKVLERRRLQLAGGMTPVEPVAATPGATAPVDEVPRETLADATIAASAVEAARNRSALAAFTTATPMATDSFRLPATEEPPLMAAAAIATPAAARVEPKAGVVDGSAADTAAAERPSIEPEPIVAEAPLVEPPPAPVEAPAAPTPTAGPPDLMIRISSRGMMTAELDGEVEHVMLDDLGSYAEALSHVAGTATIHVPTDEGMPALIAKRAQRILEDAGVGVTLA